MSAIFESLFLNHFDANNGKAACHFLVSHFITERVNEQIAIQKLLQGKLADAQKGNSRYSIRAFSKKIRINPGALSAILCGKRKISRKMAERILSNLMLDPKAQREVLSLFPVKRSRSNEVSSNQDLRILELTAAQHKMIAEWEHLSILSLLRCKDFKSDLKWISKRLLISMNRSKQVISRLADLKLIEVGRTGKIKRTSADLRTQEDRPDLSIKKSHEETLDLAKNSLYRDSVEVRDFCSMTFAINPKNLTLAKEKIRQFQEDLSVLLAEGPQTEVYRFSTQLFPLTDVCTNERMKK